MPFSHPPSNFTTATSTTSSYSFFLSSSLLTQQQTLPCLGYQAVFSFYFTSFAISESSTFLYDSHHTITSSTYTSPLIFNSSKLFTYGSHHTLIHDTYPTTSSTTHNPHHSTKGKFPAAHPSLNQSNPPQSLCPTFSPRETCGSMMARPAPSLQAL